MSLITRVFSSFLQWYRHLWPSRPRIEVRLGLWQELTEELGRRGLNGRREAGVFLLTSIKEDMRCVMRLVYFDDLDAECLVGGIYIRSLGFSKLWEICEMEGLRVLADVHTHPGRSITQSGIDRGNPMIARSGHIAIIVPYYGTRPVATHEVGVHEYRGDSGWVSWFGSDVERVLRIKRK